MEENNPVLSDYPARPLHIIILLSALLLTAGVRGLAQDAAKIDSLEQLLATGKPQKAELLDIYWNLSWLCLKVDDYEKMKEYACMGIVLAEQTENLYLLAELYNNAGVAYDYVSKMDSAMPYFEKAMETVAQMEKSAAEKPEKMARIKGFIYGSMGNLYSVQGKTGDALNCYFKALDLFEKYRIDNETANVLGNIGATYLDVDNYEQAEIYLLKKVELCRKTGNKPNLAHALAGLGNVYLYKNDLTKARLNVEEALAIFEKQDAQPANLLYCHQCLSSVYLAEGDGVKAMAYADLALQEAEEMEIPLEICRSLLLKSETCLFYGNYAAAEKTALEALRTDTTHLATNQALYECIAKAGIGLGNTGKATEYFDRHKQAQIAYANRQFQSSLSEMAVKYETEKKELQLAGQQTEIRRARTVRFALVAGLGLLAVALGLLWYMLRLRSRRNRALSSLNTALGERNHALDEMNATKDKFFNIISHDLRNPALAQRNALQMLSEHSGQWDAATLKEFYHELLDSANSNVELLNNLLNWAQVQTGRMQFKPIAADLSGTLRDEICLIRRMAEQKGVNFNVEIPVRTFVTADPRMLATIVRNLLTNAVKFTPEGGTVTLSAEMTEEKKAEITITDTGTGMTQEQITSLFCLDSRPSQPGTAGEQGTGLGLTVCREMLERHGSILQIESQPNRGSRFRFVIDSAG